MQNSREKKQFGNKGEQMCYIYLIKKGWTVLARNYRKWGGEIDLVAKDIGRNEIVFVEVKTRHGTDWFDLDQTLSGSQIYNIKKIGRRFLFENRLECENWRIDHIAILLDENDDLVRMEHFEAV